MPSFTDLGQAQRQALRADLQRRHAKLQGAGYALDMTRGKPSPEQLDLSAGLLTCLDAGGYRAADGTDCRNYGGLRGIPEARRLFADLLGLEREGVVVGGNSSLALMHAAVLQALTHGVPGGPGPWAQPPGVKFLCPSPGYDRHFRICEHFGIAMVAVDMLSGGPDMDAVEELAASDASVKGIWCVPKYSNPTGVVYSDEVVHRLAGMAAAPDFRIFWDNAYAVHDLTADPPELKSMPQACSAAGHPDRFLMFASTSKITFAGAGIAALAASPANLEWFTRNLSFQTIGPDKVNQLRHVRFLRDAQGVRRHMRAHAAILRPKFEAVEQTFRAELAGKGVAEWSRPQGGYFVSLDTMDGCARRVVELAAGAGVKLTPAGATFPYGQDPRDRNIRIAPSLPPLEEVRQAMEVVAVCVQLAAVERLVQQ